MNLKNLTSTQLSAAAKIKRRIETLTRKLAVITSDLPVEMRTRKPMSAAGRARIAAAARTRWAKYRQQKGKL